MKRFLLALGLIPLFVTARPAVADSPAADLAASPGLVLLCNNIYECIGNGPPSGFAQLLVVHNYAFETAGSSFTVDISLAPGTTLLGFESLYPHAGQLGGVQSVAYGECKSGTIEVGTVLLVAGCGELRIAPATALDCSGGEHGAYDNRVGALCTCGYQSLRCFPLPTEHFTWGKVKALYR
jgi:hypothetical protein